MPIVKLTHSPFSIQWQRAFDKSALRKFTITATSREFRVNKACIITASRHFADVLMDDSLQSAPLPPDVKPEDFELLLHYLYTGQLEFNRDRLWSMTKSAATLYLKEPYETLAKEIVSELNLKNCFATLRTADELHLELVTKQCADFIGANIENLVDQLDSETIPHEFVCLFLSESANEKVVTKLMTVAMKQISQLKTEHKRRAFLNDFLLKNETEMKSRLKNNYLTTKNCVEALRLLKEANEEDKLREFVEICLVFIGDNAKTIIDENKIVVADDEIISLLLVQQLLVDQQKCLLSAWVRAVWHSDINENVLKAKCSDFFSKAGLQEMFFKVYLSEDNCMESLKMVEAASLSESIMAEFWSFFGAHISKLVGNEIFRQNFTLANLKSLLAAPSLDKRFDKQLFLLAEQKLKQEPPEQFRPSLKEFFGVKDVQERYAKSCLDVKNCLRIIQDSFRNELSILSKHAADYVAEHLWEFLHSEQLLELPPPLFIKVMHSLERPIYSREEEIFFLLERWTDQNPNDRRQFFFEGLRGVRLTHIINLDILKTRVAFSSYVCRDENPRLLVQMVIRFREVNSQYDFLSEKMNLVHPVKRPFLIYAPWRTARRTQVPTLLNGYNSTKIYQLTSNNNTEWRRHTQEFPTQGYSVATAIADGMLLFNKDTKTWFNVSVAGDIAEQGSSLFSSMICTSDVIHEDCFISADVFDSSSRCGRVSVLDQNLTVVTELPGIDLRGLEWQFVGFCCDANELLVIGDGPVGGPHSTVKSLRLDESDPVWHQEPPLNQARETCASLSLEKSIFTIAGYDGNVWLSSVEHFDRRTGQWNELAQLSQPRSQFGAAVFNDEIWVAGGWCSRSELNSVEIFCRRTNSWRMGPKLPKPNNHMAFLSFEKFHRSGHV